MTTKSEKQQQIEFIWQESFQSELNDELREQLRQAALVGVKACLENALRQELSEQVGFAPYERSATGAKPAEAQRSGYFQRRVTTDHGEISDLRVPKLRRGNKRREWQILTRYQRCLQYVLDGLLYLYVLGLSLRDLQEGLYVQFGSLLSVSAINQVTLSIQTQVEAWQQLPITQTPLALIVDGVWVKILYTTSETWLDQAGHQRQRQQVEERVILAALAVWPDGRYQLLHYEVATNEDESQWQTFLQHLLDRGLQPDLLKLVVSDGTKGLLAAMTNLLPQTQLQRCTVHKVRGFERYLRYNHLPDRDPVTAQPLTETAAKAHRKIEISQDAHYIFKAASQPEAAARLAQFVAKWQACEPQAVKNFTWGLKRCFVFYQFDQTLHPLIHSTNLLERFFREFRTKADEIGSFPNQTSCLTIFHLVLRRDHAKHRRLVFAKT